MKKLFIVPSRWKSNSNKLNVLSFTEALYKMFNFLKSPILPEKQFSQYDLDLSLFSVNLKQNPAI